VAKVERAVQQALDMADWLMLCGSTPPGVPSSFYAKMIALARHKHVCTLLHAGGDSLREGIEARLRWRRRTSRKRSGCWGARF